MVTAKSLDPVRDPPPCQICNSPAHGTGAHDKLEEVHSARGPAVIRRCTLLVQRAGPPLELDTQCVIEQERDQLVVRLLRVRLGPPSLVRLLEVQVKGR